MYKFKNLKSLLLVLTVSLIVTGCIVSGTFVIVEDFSFSTSSGYFFEPIDLTSDPDWKDHKDDIQFIDAIGFEFKITNSSSTSTTFDAWMGDYDPAATTPSSSAFKVINALTIPAGKSTVTYAQSLTVIQNLEQMKTMAKNGQFNVWAQASDMANFAVDTANVIVTVSAGK